MQRFSGLTSGGAADVLSAREPFYRVGGDFSFNYRAFNLIGQYLYGHDQDLPFNRVPPPDSVRAGGYLQRRLPGSRLSRAPVG